MIRVADQMWERWRDAQARFDADVLDLFFSSNVSQKRALHALEGGTTDVIRELESRVSYAPGRMRCA